MIQKKSVQSQICDIMSKNCYKAMGIPIISTVATNLYPFQLSPNKSQSSKLEYLAPIAQQIYQHYRKEQFKFCDHGTTPKTVANQIQVHLKTEGDISYEINQFGVFKIKLTDQFTNALTEGIIKNTDGHQPFHEIFPILQQYELLGQNTSQQKRDVYDFFITKDSVLGDLIRYWAFNANMKVENYVGKSIHRRIFLEESMNKKVLMMVRELGGFEQQKTEIIVNDEKYSLRQSFVYQPEFVQQSVFHTFCTRSQVLQFQKMFPKHKLHKYTHNPSLNSSITSSFQNIALSSLSLTTFEELSKQIINLKNLPLEINELQINKASVNSIALYHSIQKNITNNELLKLNRNDLGSIWITFGDLIDKKQFVIANQLIKAVEKCEMSEQLEKDGLLVVEKMKRIMWRDLFSVQKDKEKQSNENGQIDCKCY